MVNDTTSSARANADRVSGLYDSISRHYDDWFSQRWPEPAIRHGEALSQILRSRGFSEGARVLDLTCGVGTQALGLASKGFSVVGVDISPQQIKEARSRAKNFVTSKTLDLNFMVGDASLISSVVSSLGPFDAIISFGNSLPLLGSEEAITQCLEQCRELLNDNGLFIVSMRDYSVLRATQPYISASGSLSGRDRSGIWLETAEWLPDGRSYVSNIIFIVTSPVKEELHYRFPSVMAMTRNEFIECLNKSDFAQVTFLPQEENPAFSFPLFIARRNG